MKQINMFVRFVSMLTLIVLAGCQPVELTVLPLTLGASDGVTIVGGDDEALRELAARLLTFPYPGAPAPDSTELLVGQLPDDLPFELPMPEGATVIGSLVQGGPMGTQIVLDVNQPAQAVVDFYVKELEAQGFEKPEAAPGQVFAPGGPQAALCETDKSIFFYVTAFDAKDRPTDVRLTAQTDRQYTSCQNDGMGMPNAAQSLLPTLTSPPNVLMRGGGGGSGSDGNSYASADFESELSVAELAAFYDPQLEKAGWEKTAESQIEYVAWSAWKLTDDKGKAWVGTLLILSNPGTPASRFVLLRVDRKP